MTHFTGLDVANILGANQIEARVSRSEEDGCSPAVCSATLPIASGRGHGDPELKTMIRSLCQGTSENAPSICSSASRKRPKGKYAHVISQ